MSVKLVEVTREPLVECTHRGDLVVADADGKVVARAGNPKTVTYLRSAAKPLQTLQVVLSGAADRYAFTDAELAIMCASHYGEPFHLDAVRSILRKAGLDESYLRCGDATSLSTDYAFDLARRGIANSPILSDCSGKHAGMLALCVFKGWPLDNYMQPDHPLQLENRRVLAVMAGYPERKIAVGVDGCSVPVFAMPLGNMAAAYARLANPARLPKDLRTASGRIFAAMNAHPEMIAGTGGFCSDLVRGAHGKLVGKLGAEGVYGVGIKKKGLGIALKFEDGGTRGISAAILSALEELGVFSAAEKKFFASWKCKSIVNDVGWTVGEIRPAFTLRLA